MGMKYEFFGEIFRYRDLFYFLVWRDVKVRYKQTVLGALWAIIQPFFTMVIFTIFFGNFAQIPSDGIPYPLFTYSALVPWTYFANSLTTTGNSLVSNANLIRKVYFPRAALPVSASISGLVDLFIASTVLVGMMAYYSVSFSLELLLLPVLIVPLVLMSLGVGMILASLNVKYRDVKHVIPFVIQLWLFVTPIIYARSIVPENLLFLTSLNPMTGIIEAFRAALLPTRAIDWELLGLSCLITLGVFLVGMFYFKRTERAFADVI